MEYVAILLAAILISFIAVRIGAFALVLTGMETEAAAFQALSAFSGTGFTTSETERVVRHRSRRRIITILIILGNAGLVAIIGSLVGAVGQDVGLPWFLIRLAVIIFGIFILYSLVIRSRLGNTLLDRLRKPLLRRIVMEAPPFEEIMHIGGQWGINLVTIGKGSKYVGASVADITAAVDVEVLGLDRSDSFVSKPEGNVEIHERDRLLVFGTTQSMKKLLGDGRAAAPAA
jgi:MFS family permease